MLFQVRLRKLWSRHNNLDLDAYTGRTAELPVVGDQFTMLTREAGNLYTTPVTEATVESQAIRFRTRNSEYRLEFIDEAAEVAKPLRRMSESEQFFRGSENIH